MTVTRQPLEPTLSIPFVLHGVHGKLAIEYGPSQDPIEAGFAVLGDLGFDIGLCRGYPMLVARIDEFGATGYRSVCGWMQIVTRHDRDSHAAGSATVATSSSIDLPPAFEGLGLPFAVYGSLPQFVDAPCRNLNASAELRWVADTFLVSPPLRSRGGPIERLAGFRWGYVETDRSSEPPTLLPLEVTGPEAWNRHLEYLRRTFPDWIFSAA